LREGKVTLPLIYALEPRRRERKLVETVLTDGNYDQVPFSKISTFCTATKGSNALRNARRRFTEKARAIIVSFRHRRISGR